MINAGAIGVTAICGVIWLATREPRLALPPATARQIRRAARANRLEVRNPPRWVASANHDFDTEDTQ